MRRSTLALALVAALAAVALTACGTTGTATPHPAVEAPPATPADTPDPDVTAAVVDLTWSQTDPADRQAMCDGIALLGPDWAAEQLTDGGGDAGLDWGLAAELIEQKCSEN